MTISFKQYLVATASLLAFPIVLPPAQADQMADASATTVETVIVTGTRQAERTVFQSSAPVDVVGADSLQAVVSDELVSKLADQVPSFNVQRLPMNDGLVFVRPATLRGLSPDHTLVLINGKRQHRSALLGSNGAEGVDLNQIPSFAVGHIEVLRDGAAAQYGSDAIAGVINVILDDKPGYRGYGEFSQYYEGDGTRYQAGAKAGFGLGSNSFILASAQWSNADETSRTIQRDDAIAYQKAHPEVDIANPVQRWGQPGQKSRRGALNAQFDLGSGIEAYSFATINRGGGISDFNWRNPANTSAYGSSPVYPDYNLYKIYPAGFTPHFGQHDLDYTGTAGIRGGDKLHWDFDVSFGRNEIAYYMSNTINASFGSDSPTSFYLGTLSQQEFNQNLDFVYPLDTGILYGPVNIAFGAEHRQETYGVAAGEHMSWAAGPGAVSGLPSGANGFPGYSDDQSGEWSSQSYAGYIDVEAPVTDKWTIGAAGRFENYSDFGSTRNGKLSTRYEILPGLALRATYSTGFRAPTPGQVHSTRTSQGLDTKTLQLFTTGRLSPNSPVAQFFGAKALKPEKSHNVSAGLAFDLGGGFSGSVDAYQVNVSDRFGTSATYTITPAIRTQLIAEGVPGADSITQVNFFTNAYKTRTQGVDIVGNYSTDLYAGTLTLTAAMNFNYTAVTHSDGTFNASTITTMEKHLPSKTANLTASYHWDRYTITGRGHYYGPWTDVSGNSTGDIFQNFGSMVLFDLAATVDITDHISAEAGAQNLFGSYPQRATYQASRGLKYSRNAPYDTDGGQYFIRFNVRY